MKFGILKSRIEDTLMESYRTKTFKEEFKNFKKYVLENKNVSKLFYLYDGLTTNKGLSKDIVDSYINECVTIYENTVNKIDTKSLSGLNKWVSNTKSKNIYEDIDTLFSSNVLNITSKIEVRKTISENLQKEVVVTESTLAGNVPFKSMVNIVNSTAKKYIESLNESDKKELMSILTEDEKVLEEKFETLKSEAIGKLNSVIIEEVDVEVKNKVKETMTKLTSESFTKLGYYKLTKLNENL
ncbi:hypothetical protein N9P74_00290 [bacterium]|nr:hypothetical protein [bacterium]MDB0072692.1 hypothetical protein [bacterium]MDB4351857.1 hypothetical protein [Porticoccaceae bacterium]